ADLVVVAEAVHPVVDEDRPERGPPSRRDQSQAGPGDQRRSPLGADEVDRARRDRVSDAHRETHLPALDLHVWTLKPMVPGGGTGWKCDRRMCSHTRMPPAAVLGEIWGSRRADAYDQCCCPR